jgi:hypothetical protein
MFDQVNEGGTEENFHGCLILLILKSNKFGSLFLLHVFRVQIPGRAGIAAETFVHVLAAYFKGEEQVFVCGVRVNAELGEVTEKTLAGVARAVREGVFGLGEEVLQFVASQFWHGLILQPIPPEIM